MEAQAQQQPREYNEGDVFYLTEKTEIGGRMFLEGTECEVLGSAICEEGEVYAQIEGTDGDSCRRMVSKELLDAVAMPNRRNGAPLTHMRAAEIRNADGDWENVMRKSDATEGARVTREAFYKILRKG